MAQTDESNVIIYLRPQTKGAIGLLDAKSNKGFIETRLPPPVLCDTRLEGIPERIPASQLSSHTTHEPTSNLSRESTPDPYSVHPRVLKLGFKTKTAHTERGYYFGSLNDCQVEMPYHDKTSDQGCYFCIRYNFNSGALLILAMNKMRVGSTTLEKNESLLVMPDTIIDCGGGAFQFIMEFPDLSQCAAAHERNYEKYVAKLNLQNALYMATFREQDPPIGNLHRSKALLGQGSFGEVHKAVHVQTGELCAIKMLSDNEGQDTLREVKILSALSHPNIIEYREAFKFRGKVCIVMELAANDLYKHRDARKGSRKPYLPLRCIRHIMYQLLSGIEYIHSESYTHRDLKPTNILVTQWDSKTDLPTVKLADFGLAGIKPDLSSLCGTSGYLAPEIEAEIARQKHLRKRKATGYKTVDQPFYYDNSVDIWALGQILKELIEEVPNEITVRGTKMAVNKQPATQLALYMMNPSPEERPTASACLQHAWLIEDKPSVLKRDRSPTPGSIAILPPKRVLRTTPPTRQSSTQMLPEAMFTNDRKSEIGTDNRLVSRSVANPDGGSSHISIHRNASQGSTFRLVTSIERALAGTRSSDLRTNLDDLNVMNSDTRLYSTAPMYPAELDDETQGVQWQLDRYFIDANHLAYEELGEPGPTLR